MALLTFRINVRLAKLQGALDAIEAVKTGVEQNSQMAEKSAIKFFASIRAAVDSREKEVLKVPQLQLYTLSLNDQTSNFSLEKID